MKLWKKESWFTEPDILLSQAQYTNNPKGDVSNGNVYIEFNTI